MKVEFSGRYRKHRYAIAYGKGYRIGIVESKYSINSCVLPIRKLSHPCQEGIIGNKLFFFFECNLLSDGRSMKLVDKQQLARLSSTYPTIDLEAQLERSYADNADLPIRSLQYCIQTCKDIIDQLISYKKPHPIAR
jgi:hypothetical protein